MPAATLAGICLLWLAWLLAVGSLLAQPNQTASLASFVAAHARPLAALALWAVISVAFSMGRSWARMAIAGIAIVAIAAWLAAPLAGLDMRLGDRRLIRMIMTMVAAAVWLSFSASGRLWFERGNQPTDA